MIVAKTVKDLVQYITEGFAEIFSPNKDSYPLVGVQPYSGTINSRTGYYEW